MIKKDIDIELILVKMSERRFHPIILLQMVQKELLKEIKKEENELRIKKINYRLSFISSNSIKDSFYLNELKKEVF